MTLTVSESICAVWSHKYYLLVPNIQRFSRNISIAGFFLSPCMDQQVDVFIIFSILTSNFIPGRYFRIYSYILCFILILRAFSYSILLLRQGLIAIKRTCCHITLDNHIFTPYELSEAPGRSNYYRISIS